MPVPLPSAPRFPLNHNSIPPQDPTITTVPRHPTFVAQDALLRVLEPAVGRRAADLRLARPGIAELELDVRVGGGARAG